MPEFPLLELEKLRIVRSRPGGPEPLLHGISLTLGRGESLGLVGESGSGKSLTALALVNLLPAPEVYRQGGSIRFRGQPIERQNDLRGSRLAIIFQDALASLNPVRRIGPQLDEVFRFHRRPIDDGRIQLCLEKAGLFDTARILRAYPHELSGGMRQRLMLAMALLLNPELLIADEPTTALDVTLQARWVEQLKILRRDEQLALLCISHDLGLLAEVVERIAVLYRGHLVESGPTALILERAGHPYTQAMISALTQIPTPVRSAVETGIGCPYAEQCPLVLPQCRASMPETITREGHSIACHAVQP